MKSHWNVHMKNGDTLDFDCRAHHILRNSKEDPMVTIMTGKFGDTLAIIPPENILWIEAVIEEDDDDGEE